MARVFALADLHLSLIGAKPMDRFGEIWVDHAQQMATHWDAAVAEEDTVLLPGDLSWARNPKEAVPDLAWIGARPGRKLLLKGNHDSWWGSMAKLREALPPRCEPLHNNALEIGEWVVIGARGWTAPDDPYAVEGEEKLYRRELDRLRTSISAADKTFGRERPRLAMLHFPPWLEGREPGEVVDLLRRAGAKICVYGHLHGEDHRLAVTGEREGIRFYFVACDAVGFAPVELNLG